MSLGSTKSSRLKIAFIALSVSVVLLLFIPFVKGLSEYRGLDPARTSALDQYWPAVYLLSIALIISMLTVILTHLLRIDAKGEATFKVFWIEAPIELRGASLLLFALAIAAGAATYFWNITGLGELDDQLAELQTENTRLEGLMGELEDKNAALDQQKELLLAILTGERNSDGIQVLSLSVACGSTSADRHSAWELYRPNTEDLWFTYETPDEPLTVGHQPRTYRMSTRGQEMIKLDVEFTEEGIVRVDLDGNTRLSEFCSWISEPPSSGFGTENAEHVEIPAEIQTSNDIDELGEISTSSKRDG